MDTHCIADHFTLIDKKLRESKNMSHLFWVDHYKQVRTSWFKQQNIHHYDVQFLQTLINTPFAELKHFAYMWGEWYDLTPQKVTYYNLLNKYRPKQVKKCKLPATYR